MTTVCKRSLTLGEQRSWISDIRNVIRAAPLVRPITSSGHPMKVRITAAGKLGWVADESYRYSEVQADGKPWPPIPGRWLELANEVAGEHPWDSVIINWYDLDASLGWHEDEDEADLSRPIVTVSLGDTCSWAVRDGLGRVLERVKLESGAITLLAGATRNLKHTVEKIIPSPLLSPLPVRGRVSATIRVAGEPCT